MEEKKPRLQEKYQKEVIDKLKQEFGYKNIFEVPRLEKVVINVGVGKGIKDSAFLETVDNTLRRISGQKPIKTKAKKSISGFKIRKGMEIGMKVTIRGSRMYEFVDKLINISFPRVRDFRGINPSSVDKSGNLSVGFKEHLVFGEITSAELERIHGLEVCVVTTAKTRDEGLRLLTLLGFPFKQKI